MSPVVANPLRSKAVKVEGLRGSEIRGIDHTFCCVWLATVASAVVIAYFLRLCEDIRVWAVARGADVDVCVYVCSERKYHMIPYGVPLLFMRVDAMM